MAKLTRLRVGFVLESQVLRMAGEMAIEFVLADYGNEEHATAILNLLNEYALTPLGGGEALSPYAQENLIATLAEAPFAFSVLGFGSAEGERKAVALANCFRTLSTFSCLPLINIHDLVISAEAQGQGMSQLLLGFVENHAKATGCCKVTLEVLEGHEFARKAYTKFGFKPYTLGVDSGHAIYMQKKL